VRRFKRDGTIELTVKPVVLAIAASSPLFGGVAEKIRFRRLR